MEKAVATPIEQQINGVDNMDYMYSLNSTNNSSTALMVDFDLKTDPNMDLILTQSRQQLAIGQLPPEVNQIGIDVKKSLTSPMMLVALYSPKGTHDAKFLSNYAYINLNDPIARSYGVGQTQIYGIGAVRDAPVGETRSTGEVGHHRQRGRQCSASAEHGESGRSGGRRTSRRRPAVHLCRTRSRPA